MRLYTALRDGVVVRRGTFQDEGLLRQDLPAPEYDLLLDQYLPFLEPEATYDQLRAAAYPPLSDFADALYWQAHGKPEKMEVYLAAVEAVKARYPKP